eukprot:365718-Chlamydomonas_euryale.AAC.23
MAGREQAGNWVKQRRCGSCTSLRSPHLPAAHLEAGAPHIRRQLIHKRGLLLDACLQKRRSRAAQPGSAARVVSGPETDGEQGMRSSADVVTLPWHLALPLAQSLATYIVT